MRSLPLNTQDAETRPLKVINLKPAPARPLAASANVRRISSHNLLEGGRELIIEHHGSQYHLRLTRNDKLILTK